MSFRPVLHYCYIAIVQGNTLGPHKSPRGLHARICNGVADLAPSSHCVHNIALSGAGWHGVVARGVGRQVPAQLHEGGGHR
jgi:hypothetical protein